MDPLAAASALLVAIGLCACGPVPAPVPPAKPPVLTIAASPPTTAAPAASTAEPAAPVEPPVALPPAVERPSEVACSWTSDRWRSSSAIELRLRPGGPVFARIAGGPRAHVQIPIGPHDHAIADASSGGLVLTGIVDDSAVKLHAVHAFPMNGVLYPQSTAPLTWTAGLAGKVTVSVSVPKQITVVRPPAGATTECSNVSLDRGGRIDVNSEIFGMSSGSFRYLPAGRWIDVHSDPARPADARLFLSETTAANAFSRGGPFVRIGVLVDQIYVAGWVRSSVVLSSDGGVGTFGVGYGTVGIGETVRKPLLKVVCPANVPVVAEVLGETATVGLVQAGAVIDVLERRGLFSRVLVLNRGLHVVDAAALLARTSDLAACPPATD